LRKESVHVRKDGTSFPVEIISTFVNFEGWELICGFAQDITQRKLVENELLKAKEKAEESDRLKSAFLANMSHEIRTPMNAVVGFSSFLAKPNLTTEKRNHFISLIKERSLDLLRIIEDIIDISKIEVFQLKIFETEIVLSEFVNEIAELYKLKTSQGLSKTSVRLIFEIDENLKKAIIKTDNLRLKQVIYNLIDNALKFTREGSIEFSCMSTPDGYILFKVKDTGIGIPSNMHDVIFDRFRQVEDIHEARQYGGTGLGLSIVKGIISLLNGKVWLESKVGIGSTFFFTIPLKTGRNIDNKESKTKAKTLSWKGKTVLVVEDDVANAEFLNEILSELQLQVLNACNGAEALRIFKNNPHIDLVLMDILLPDINGLQLTRVFKKENPQMPVIAQTAYAGSNDLNECLAAGCSSCISKPIMYEQIKEVVGKFLNNDI
jgi:signal transduction histidine kinase/CheY-like chemotaxis protein